MPFENQSVWKEQVDEAFVSYIESKVISIGNSKTPVNVAMRKPDEDFKVELYPIITVYNLYDELDNIRRSGWQEDIMLSKDYDNYKGIMDERALPYDLYYQIDFWSTLQNHMNDMTRQWIGKINNRYFNLDVKDMSGNDRNSFVLQQGTLKKADLMNGSNRIFHSFLIYRVWVELDEAEPYEIPLVRKVIIKKKMRG